MKALRDIRKIKTQTKMRERMDEGFNNDESARKFVQNDSAAD